jgi:acetyl esterase/lipase
MGVTGFSQARRTAVRAGVWTAAAAVMLAGCSPLTALNWSVPEDGYRVTAAQRYGPHPRQALDLYLPDRPRAGAPVVVFFYGGSWKNGNRADYRFAAEAFASRGFAVAVPDYRTYPEVRFPAFVEDGALAVRWVTENAERFALAPDIALAGHSAGAHTAALLAYDPRYLAGAGVARERIVGVVGLAGPFDLDLLAYRSTRPVFEAWPRADDFRPTAFDIPQPSAPALLLHGASDGTVPARDSERMAERLKAQGAEAHAVIYPKTGHAGILVALAPPFRGGDAPVLEDALRFLSGLTGAYAKY